MRAGDDVFGRGGGSAACQGREEDGEEDEGDEGGGGCEVGLHGLLAGWDDDWMMVGPLGVGRARRLAGRSLLLDGAVRHCYDCQDDGLVLQWRTFGRFGGLGSVERCGSGLI